MTEPGVLRFEVARGQDHPNVFTLWEEYRDDAALAAHFKTDHFKRLGLEGIRRLALDRHAEKAQPLP